MPEAAIAIIGERYTGLLIDHHICHGHRWGAVA
jgi:hypothetical protein